MNDTVGEPSHDAEKCASMCGKNVAQIGTIKYVFNGRENADPDRRSPTARNEAATHD